MKQTESQFYPRIIALVTAGLLGVATFQIFQPFLGPLLWAGLFAFILFPVNQALRRAFRGRKGAAALLLTLGVHLVIVFPALLSVGVFVTQSSNLVGRLHAAADRYYIAKASDLFRVLVFERGMRWIWTMVPVTVEQTREWIVRGGERLLQTLMSLSSSLFAGALGAFVGLPSPIVLGVLGMGAALLPLVGTAIIWVPAAVVLAAQGRWGAAVFIAPWGALVVSSADNFVRSIFISGRAEISTFPVFIGLLGGISAFGPIGIFLGPVVVALVLALLRFAEESRGRIGTQQRPAQAAEGLSVRPGRAAAVPASANRSGLQHPSLLAHAARLGM